MNSSDTLEELCRRLRASDRDAFGMLFHQLREGLVRYVQGIVGRDMVAHDLVQDVFVYLWSLRETLDPTQSLKALVYRMARNRAYRFLRDERVHAKKQALIKQQTPIRVNGFAGMEDRLDADALAGRLRVWLSALPDRQREALLLSRLHALSHREIAAVMGVSPRTVNNHIMRALEHLRERMQTYEPTRVKP